MCPVHVRAEPGDFAESVLLPGDPLRAKNMVRVGTCGGYSRELRLGDLIVATSAAPQDGTVSSLTRGVPYAPAAHFDVVHAAHHAAESAGRSTFVGQIVSSDLFYDPTEDPATLWGDLGVLGVEMEAAVIFTIAAMHDVRAGCLLTVSDTISAEIVRISDEELRNAVDNLMALALATLNA